MSRLCSRRAWQCPYPVKIRSAGYTTTSVSPHPRAVPVGTTPRFTQPSVWTSLIPKYLRGDSQKIPKVRSTKSKEWNPATFYIVVFLLIGSNAIQMIALKHEFLTFSRKAEARLNLLREVIRRLQAGEEVDIAGALGTGDDMQEKEWADGI